MLNLNMKGIILAGGTGSRLYPLTKVINKHLLPVYDRPMIFYPLTTLLTAGIEHILIISGTEHAGDFLELLSDGTAFVEDVRKLDGEGALKGKKLRLSYAVQPAAGGIAQALSLAEEFSDGGPVTVMLGDNILNEDLSVLVQSFARQKTGAKIFLTEVAHPEHYGIAEIADGRIERIVEKPAHPQSRLAVAGVYMYDAQVWSMIKSLMPSARGELEITDVNNAYIEKGQMTFEILAGWWGDGGESFDSLQQAGRHIAETRRL